MPIYCVSSFPCLYQSYIKIFGSDKLPEPTSVLKVHMVEVCCVWGVLEVQVRMVGVCPSALEVRGSPIVLKA